MATSRRANPKTKGPLRRALRAVAGTAGRTILVLTVLASGASGSSISIPPGTLTATSVTGTTGAPTVYVWDDFNRPNGSIGSPVVGGVWGQNVGTWTVRGNQARASSTAIGNATVTVPGVLDARLDADLTFGTAAQAGIDFNDDGNNNMMVLYNRGGGTSQVRLYAWIGTGAFPAPVATANVASTSSASLTVITLGTNVQVLWNGGLIISYNLTPTQAAALKDAGSNEFGLWAESDSTSRFDNFKVESV